MRDRFVDKFPLADGRVLEFVFEDFPQKVCSPCGERYYEAKDLIAAEDAVTRELMARGIRDSAVFKYLRKALGLKATELADLLGVTAETISRWENGHNEADLAVWAALHFLVDDHRSGLTTTLDRLRRLVEARIPKRPVPLTLARAHGATLEALADVDSGHVIDHQAVQAWADSLGTRKPRPPPRR